MTFSTLTQGKAAPGRDSRGHKRKGSLQSHSRSWEGKGPSQDPSTSGNESRGPGQGLVNLYTWGCASTDLYKQRDKSFIARTDVEAETLIFGYLMRRTDSFEKTLMLGKIEGRRRRG